MHPGSYTHRFLKTPHATYTQPCHEIIFHAPHIPHTHCSYTLINAHTHLVYKLYHIPHTYTYAAHTHLYGKLIKTTYIPKRLLLHNPITPFTLVLTPQNIHKPIC